MCVEGGSGGMKDLNGEGVLWWPVNGGGAQRTTESEVHACMCACYNVFCITNVVGMYICPQGQSVHFGQQILGFILR